MNYFDDITFLRVSRINSRSNSIPCKVIDYWGMGLMLGNGFVKLISGNEDFRLKMPFLYLIHPGCCSSWESMDGTERENRWFIIQGPRAERMVTALQPYCTSSTSIIHLNGYQDLIRIHQRMLKLHQYGVPSKAYRLAVCTEEFIGTVYDLLSDTRQKSPVFLLVAELVKEIGNAPGATYDFMELARRKRISYDHFRRRFQEYTGLPVHEFLLQKRLEFGLMLLRESEDSIKEISERCGFPRQAEFTRFIRQRTGMTPTNLRLRPDVDSIR